MKTNGRQQAVVIGASMAGMMAARALSERFERVTILERDTLPQAPGPRRAVPQARHIHVMLKSGMDFVESLFPGITKDIVATGSNPMDFGRDVAWYIEGFWRARPKTNLTLYAQTRPLLDWHVMSRLRAIQNLDIRERCDVRGLIHGERGVQGARVILDGSKTEEPIHADLVVDASGRGTRSPLWLEEMGYGRPELEESRIDLCYTSCLMRPPGEWRPDWKILGVFGSRQNQYRTGVIIAVENRQWHVSLIGYHGIHAHPDQQGFLEFARSLEVPDIYDAIRDAVPLTPVVSHKVPASRRYRYERLPSQPDGFVILGDALCSFNPAYAQGITSAAKTVGALAQLLDKWKQTSLAGFAPAFQKQASAAVDFPWLVALTEDLGHPESIGPRPAWIRPVTWFKRQLMRACAADDDLAIRLMKVICSQDEVGPLLHPWAITRILRSAAAFRLKSLRASR
jgi:2-polyprenyl-6-methoxyphenol hydroxylase-like FAD-dependent oxidoreductase